ncbi:MAG: hypothetical protein F6J92_20265 [Symploca sp. SIO1A3]|nr:hypothetical protein [Symploca sp. SIO1A3]
MNPKVMEIVIFKTKDSVSDDVMKKAVKKTNPVLDKINGFLSRQLGTTQNREQWADILYWQDLKSAQEATSIFMEHPDCQEFISLVEEKEVQMIHLDLLIGVPPLK